MKRLWILAAALALPLIIGGVAYASIPGPDGTIHGCYKTSNPAQGAVIVVDSAASCPSGYTALNWNQPGPSQELYGPYEVRLTFDVPNDGLMHDSFFQCSPQGVDAITGVAAYTYDTTSPQDIHSYGPGVRLDPNTAGWAVAGHVYSRGNDPAGAFSHTEVDLSCAHVAP